MKIAVVTPLWNRADLTMKFYRAHVSRGLATRARYVAVDNGSTDATASVLLSLYSSFCQTDRHNLLVLQNPTNLGFGPANNQGWRAADCDVVVFLSNDVEIRGDYLTPIAAAARDDVLLGAELIDWDSGWNCFDGKVIPYLAGWCIAATRNTLDALDGWDEQYVPCDYEDIDLSKLAVEAGMSLMPLSLPLHHVSGQSALRLAGGRLQITLRNRTKFMEKWGYQQITGRSRTG